MRQRGALDRPVVPPEYRSSSRSAPPSATGSNVSDSPAAMARASGIEPGGSASHVPAGASTTPRSPRPTLSTVRTRVPPTTSANVPIDPPHTSATSTPASLS